jgi:4-hydroxyphenylpyruvate dioxygenase-like putative hemolysin
MAAPVELIAPLGRFGTHGEFFTNYIEEHGEDVQSIVFKVDDLDAATRHAVDGGVIVLRRFQTAGTELVRAPIQRVH